jgi:putative hydrolase of the HAD superfamily
MIRAVFFDFDGTLYDRDLALRRMAEEQFAKFSSELSMGESAFVSRLLALDNHGHGRPRHMHHKLAEELGFSNDLADRLEACFRLNYPNHCNPPEDCLTTLGSLRAKRIKLGIITNGPVSWQMRKIEKTGVAPFFDAILVSDAEGIQKPDPRIFARALERCSVDAEESLFVGDHPEADIMGAKNAGLQPVWKRKPYWEVPDDVPRIDQLSEVLSMVFQKASSPVDSGKRI